MLDRLKETISCSDEDCQILLCNRLRDMGYKLCIGLGGTYIFGIPPGDKVCPILMCAHWDTIRQSSGKWSDMPVVLFEENGKIENANGILGADDRAGCQLILEVASSLSAKPFVLFTSYEEVGMKGMHTFIEDDEISMYQEYIYLILSVDRAGHNEAVYYSNYPSGILEYYLNKVGYVVHKSSSSTDGLLLSSVLRLEHINVSYGGYNPHNCDEFILVDSYVGNFWRLLNFIQLINRPFPLSSSSDWVTPSEHNGFGTAVLEPEEYSLPAPVCAVCGKPERLPRYSPAAKAWLCNSCLNRMITNYSTPITPEMVEQHKLQLKAEQLRSREANLKQVKHNSDFPTCPVCGTNENVSWNAIIAGFTCNKCRHMWYQGQSSYDGIFWVMSEGGILRKIYSPSKDTAMVRTEQENQVRLEWLGPLKECPYLSVCATCGTVAPVLHSINMQFQDQQRTIQVCTTCLAELQSVGQLIDPVPF